jgi:hypothetical protein
MIGCITSEGIAASNAAAAEKTYAARGIAEGPGEPLPRVAEPQPQEWDRAYIAPGHAAECLSNRPPLRVAASWRAGVHGDGPVARQMGNWTPGVTAGVQPRAAQGCGT